MRNPTIFAKVDVDGRTVTLRPAFFTEDVTEKKWNRILKSWVRIGQHRAGYLPEDDDFDLRVIPYERPVAPRYIFAYNASSRWRAIVCLKPYVFCGVIERAGRGFRFARIDRFSGEPDDMEHKEALFAYTAYDAARRKKEGPNQALLPTTTAVTPAASHPSRQP